LGNLSTLTSFNSENNPWEQSLYYDLKNPYIYPK
jgi:hypothetical protein